MWFDPSSDDSRWADAARYLCAADPVLAKVIRRVGPCQMSPRRDYFVALCRAIFAQQLNTKVAQVLFDRFQDRLPGRRVSPDRVLELLADESAYRGCGLSRQKAGYLRDLAAHFADNRIPTRKLARMTDEDVIQALVNVKGVGRWTAEMFLMFVLNRPDVLPVDDLGLREGVRDIYQLKERPGAADLTTLAECWRPYRSVGTWYVWRRNANLPVETPTEPKPARRTRAATTRRRPAPARKTS